ncbi:MAG: MBL fold metallo-hydrolase [Clostridia bacterium]|nr:MBL fold metallo-hydrolase [Clostridia bacterium]
MKIDTLVVGPVQTNCYIVYNEGAEEAVVIDPGANPEKIKETLDGKRAAAVLLTHGHFDHTGALSAFEGTPIYIHPSDDVMLSDTVWSAGTLIGDTAPRPAATDYVREGTRLHLAGLDISVMHTPGHTLGSVVYAIGDTLFTGDTLFRGGYGRTDLMGGDMDELARSIMRLMREEKNWIICPGHGSFSTLNEEKEKYL